MIRNSAIRHSAFARAEAHKDMRLTALDRRVHLAFDWVPATSGGVVTIEGDTAIFTGTPGLDFLQISVENGVEVATFNEQRYALGPDVQQIVVDLGDGNDLCDLTLSALPARVFGGTGSDAIVCGSAADRVYGGDGDDIIGGGSGNDRLSGESGGDIIAGQNGRDRIYGGEGGDAIAAGKGRDTVWGDAGDDILGGENDPDRLYGGDGDDAITGGNGADTLSGDDGYDMLLGDHGNDTIYARDGRADLYVDGGKGRDKFWIDDADQGVVNNVETRITF